MPDGGPGNGPFNKSTFVIFLLFLPLFFGLVLVLLGIMQWKQLKILVAPEPMELPLVPASRPAEDSLQALVRGFFAGSGADTLHLGAADLNHLVRSTKQIRDLGWTYHLELADSLAVVKTSMPAEKMSGPAAALIKVFRIKGWLNSEVHAYPHLEDGKVTIVPVRAKMNGEAAPATALTRRGELNPREWVEDKAGYDSAVARLADVRIQGGRLLLVRKA